MNNKKTYIIIFLLFVIITSCSVFSIAHSKNPKKVAARFLKHFYNGEYEEAKKYSTTKTRQIIDLMDQLVAISGQKITPGNQKIVLLDCTQKGDTALCYYLINDTKSEITMVKIDNRWLADLKKEGKAYPKEKNKFLEEFLKNSKPDENKK